MSGNVGILADLILLALLLIGLVLGWRQGFVQALTRIIVVVAALLLASWIAGKLAEPAARWLEPILSEKLEQRLTAQGNTDDAGEMLAAFGFEGDTLSELVDNAVEKAQQAGETLLSAVVSTALKSAAYAVVYVVAFLLLLLLLRLVLTPLHLFTKLPVVHGVNALLGGVLGFFFIREPDLPRGQGSYFANILYGFRPAVIRDNPRLYLSLAALGVYCMSQQVYMPYLIIYIQRFLGITDYTLLLAGVLIVSSVLSVLAGRPIDRFGKLRCLVPAGVLGFAGLVLRYFARGQWCVLAAGIVMLGGGMVVSACCSGLIRDYTPAGKAGLFQGIRIVFQVLLPMVTGPYIGAAVIRGTGMTYEDLGSVKQVPTAEIFLAAAAALVLLAIPAAFLKRKETVK